MSLALKKPNLVTVNFRSVLVRLFLSGKGITGEGQYVGISGPPDVTVATKLFLKGSQNPQGP